MNQPTSRSGEEIQEHILDIRILAEQMALTAEGVPGMNLTLSKARIARVCRALLASASEKPAQEDRALNLLRGLHKVVLDLAPHFEKPITDDNVTRWLALNSAQAAVKEFLDAPNR